MKAPSPRDAASRTALEHEVRDDAVELGALVVERLAGFTDTLLARAERAEVLDGLGHHLAEELHRDAAGSLAADLNVEKHAVGDLRALLLRVDDAGRHKGERKDGNELHVYRF